jgi:hypothetical protein
MDSHIFKHRFKIMWNIVIACLFENVLICAVLVLTFVYYILLLDRSFSKIWNRIDGVMVSVLASSPVDRGFEPRSGQTKNYKIGICCISVKYTALRRKRKDLLVRNQDNVSEWRDMSFHGV